MKYVALNTKGFEKVVKAVNIGANGKGFLMNISSKLKEGVVSCGLSATTDGVIQATGVFAARLVQVEVSEDGKESPVANPQGFARAVSLPAHFADAAIALTSMEENLVIMIKDNEVILKNRKATVNIPIIQDLTLSKNPTGYVEAKFSCDRAALASCAKKMKVTLKSDKADFNDSLSFKIHGDGSMSLFTFGGYIIMNSKISVTEVLKDGESFPEIESFTLDAGKLVSIASMDSDDKRMKFTLYIDESKKVKQCNISVGKYVFMLQPKTAIPDSIQRLVEENKSSYVYRVKANAKDIKTAMNLLAIGNNLDEIRAAITPGTESMVIRDEQKTRENVIACGEPEGIIDPEKGIIRSKVKVFLAALVPFDETITVALCENKPLVYFTDDNIHVMATQTSTPKEDTVESEEADDTAQEE